MIVIGNVIYVVWSEDTTGSESGDAEIFFTKSVNGGATFTQKINLSNNPGDSNLPSIGVFRNIVHIVWSDRTTESGSGEILYRKSFNGGNTFANAINLSNTQSGSSIPSLAFNNNLYLVWEDQQGPDNFDIVFRKSNNNGITFDAALNLSNNPGDSRSAKIGASQDNVYIVWDDRTGKILGRDVFFIRSTNGGISFGATTIIIPDASSSDIAVTPNVA
jgi:ethanolamine utilization microcompartment shell protein EutL